ncbi:MAG: hypothetical protein SGBAC_013114 [Bacillariaceae sp.]
MMPGFHPKVIVDGLPLGENRLAFPLSKSQAQSLIESTAAVLDGKTQRVWKIDAERIAFRDHDEWYSQLGQITKDCIAGLGLNANQESNIVPNLCSMLLSGAGATPRGAEKPPSKHFATMVIQLPSWYTGGERIVHYKGKTTKVDWSERSDDGFFVTSFLADCNNLLMEVKSGYQLCLVYDLVFQKTTGTN